MRPYTDSQKVGNVVVREFSPNVDIEDLKWHRDREDRLIEPLEETDWKLQYDNELPINIKGEIFIPKGVWHRAIKGSKNLKIKITKYE